MEHRVLYFIIVLINEMSVIESVLLWSNAYSFCRRVFTVRPRAVSQKKSVKNQKILLVYIGLILSKLAKV